MVQKSLKRLPPHSQSPVQTTRRTGMKTLVKWNAILLKGQTAWKTLWRTWNLKDLRLGLMMESGKLLLTTQQKVLKMPPIQWACQVRLFLQCSTKSKKLADTLTSSLMPKVELRLLEVFMEI